MLFGDGHSKPSASPGAGGPSRVVEMPSWRCSRIVEKRYSDFVALDAELSRCSSLRREPLPQKGVLGLRRRFWEGLAEHQLSLSWGEPHEAVGHLGPKREGSPKSWHGDSVAQRSRRWAKLGTTGTT